MGGRSLGTRVGWDNFVGVTRVRRRVSVVCAKSNVER